MDPTNEPSPFSEEGEPDTAPATTGEVAAVKPEPRTPARPRPSIDPHRLLPQSTDAEEAFMGTLLIAPKEVLALCIEKGFKPDWLFTPAFYTIFTAVYSLDAQNKPVDFITVTQFLKDCGELKTIPGGAAAITEMFAKMPTAANAAYYLEILQEKWILREIIRAGSGAAALAYDEQDNVHGLLDDFEARVMAIRQSRKAVQTFRAPEVMSEAMAALRWRHANPSKISGLCTGFPDLDRAIDGLARQEFIVIAARPSLGKTALALNIAEYISLDLQIPAAVFSLEMSMGQLGRRLCYSRGEVNSVKVRDFGMSDAELARLEQASAEISRSKLIIEEASDLTIQEFRGRARQLVRDFGVQAIFVDSMSAMKSSSKKAEKRHLEVAECSAGFKQCAKELHIPIIVICHLGRDYENRGGTPRLSDLRESGNIEQDADTVCFLDPQLNDDGTATGIVDLFFPKMRNGELGRRVPLRYDKRYTRFYPVPIQSNQGELI